LPPTLALRVKRINPYLFSGCVIGSGMGDYCRYRYSPMLFDFFATLIQKIRSLIPGNLIERKCPACATPVKGAEKYCWLAATILNLSTVKTVMQK